LARPTRKELEGKQKEVNQLTTEINRVNDNLLTLKEGDRLEIARLKSEGKNYKKQRDSRTDISFTEYEELLTEKGNLNTTLTETIQNLTDARSEITERDGAIGKLEEDNKFLTGTNRAYREFIEELTGPGIAEKIVKKSFSNHPGKSAVGTAALGYLAKEYLKKWRNIPKVEQLEKEKKEQESKLTKKIGQLMVELSSEKIKNKQLAKDKKLLAKSTQVLYKDAEWLKREHKEGEKLIKKLRHRIAEIKKFYKEELQKVQTKLPSLALIKYEPSQEISERDTQFNSSLQKTFSLMVKEIENLQLKACSETYHQRIRLEQEKEVINQINTDCKLGCGSDSNLNQVISKIKELIDTPRAS